MARTVKILVVGGGGGGGAGYYAGGGGGGGYLYDASFEVGLNSYTVTVGDGGAGGTDNSAKGSNGANSVFGSLTAYGGGGGGTYHNSTLGSGADGGSGGGACYQNYNGGTATSGQGYDGGDCASGDYWGAGGGGAGAVGGAGTNPETQGGAGGVGLSNTILDGSTDFYSGSPSISPSISPSPSPGWVDYTRGNYASLPADETDLKNIYTAQEYTDVSTRDDVRVGQGGASEYVLHQFKDYVGSESLVELWWEGRSTIAPSVSTVYLQIYNIDTDTWDNVDSDDSTAANTDFELDGVISDLTNYKNASSVISCRVYQSFI